jgi:hypothetical protein
MAGISKGVNKGVQLALGFVAVVIVCATVQWLWPAQTERPIAERFLCNGAPVQLTPVSESNSRTPLTRVTCEGAVADDVTLMAFVSLTIPCALILAAGTVLVKKLVLPAPRTHTQRAHA